MKNIFIICILVSITSNAQTLISPNAAVNIYEKESLYFNHVSSSLQLKNSSISLLKESVPGAQYFDISLSTTDYITTTNPDFLQEFTPTVDGLIVYIDVLGVDLYSGLGSRVITNSILDLIDKSNNVVIATSDESFLVRGEGCRINTTCPPQDHVRYSLSPFPLRLQAGKTYTIRLRNTSSQFAPAITCSNIYTYSATNLSCTNQTEKADLLFRTVFVGIQEKASINSEGDALFNNVNANVIDAVQINANQIGVRNEIVRPIHTNWMEIGASETKCKDVIYSFGQRFLMLSLLCTSEPGTDFPDCYTASIRKYTFDPVTNFQTGIVIRVCRVDGEAWGQSPRVYMNYQLLD